MRMATDGTISTFNPATESLTLYSKCLRHYFTPNDTDSLASQTPPLFEIGRRGGSLVNRVEFSVPAKPPHVNCEYLVRRWRVKVHCFFFIIKLLLLLFCLLKLHMTFLEDFKKSKLWGMERLPKSGL